MVLVKQTIVKGISMDFKQYDDRIARIMSKMEALKEREFYITCGDWPCVWEAPVPENKVASFEKKKGIRLPEDYRRFITTVAGSGSQPFYGLEMYNDNEYDVEQPFPYTLDNPVYFLYMTEEEMDAFYDEDVKIAADNGLLTLCTEGCGMDSVLVVNSEDPATYGTVWYLDLANDVGIIPMYDPKTKKPFHFLDWLEYWVDRTAELDNDKYFGFSETVKLPEMPDNPDIMGRKMGWIK